MRRRHAALPLLLLTALAPALRSEAIPVQRVASGLSAPMFVAAPAGDDRLFIVERAGTIRILQDGQVLGDPFLDIRDRVDAQGEGGLLGLAFPPDYASSRAFYVYYTADGSPLTSRISRFRASAANPNAADPGQEKVLLSQPQPFDNHNGGTVAFGPDGMLYMGFGDGGDGGDPGERAQNPGTLLGKMIRIDVSFSSFSDGYAIPDDNPFAGPDGVLDEIWAFGLRNPFRFGFDRATGDLYIGDVGQNAIEEIDVEPASSSGGLNYGWDVMEGTSCFEDPDPGEPACHAPSLTLPIHEYDHGVGNAVTGGVVYRGSEPSLQGLYVFGDYGASEIWTLQWDGGDGIVGDVANRTSELVPDAGSISNPVAFGEDGDGELYVVDPGGEVFRVPEPARLVLAAVGAAVLAGVRRLTRRPRSPTRAASGTAR
jgi:glucose/arabinose dehydrogenase